MASDSGVAQISTVQFPVLRNADDGLTAEAIQDFATETIRLIQAHPNLHKSHRVLHQGVHRNVQLTLQIFLEGQGKPAPIFTYPADLDLNVGSSQAKLDAVKAFELKWLEELRASVSRDTTQSILDSLSAIALPRVVQTPAVVLAYTGKIARFIDNTDEVAFAKITPKQVNAALMRSWWPELRHLLEDSGNTSTDDWMTILRRLAGFATQAEQARFILNALSPPPPKKHPLQQTPTQDSAKRPNNNPTPTTDPPTDTDKKIEDVILLCEDCKSGFTWTVQQQEFGASKGHTTPKRCKTCREKRKAEREAASSDKPRTATSVPRLAVTYNKDKP